MPADLGLWLTRGLGALVLRAMVAVELSCLRWAVSGLLGGHDIRVTTGSVAVDGLPRDNAMVGSVVRTYHF